MWMWLLGAWFSGKHSGAGLTVGLDYLRGLFQPQRLCDFIVVSCLSINSQQVHQDGRQEAPLGTLSLSSSKKRIHVTPAVSCFIFASLKLTVELGYIFCPEQFALCHFLV